MNNFYIVSDTNIFIDLIQLSLIDEFFLLPYQFFTTDFVLSEIKNNEQKLILNNYVKNGKLVVRKFDENQVEILVQINQLYSGLSLTDVSVWRLAKTIKGHLLTGDALLKKCALKDKVEVSGLLFLIEQLAVRKLKTSKELCGKLEELVLNNSRAPKKQIQELIAKLKSL